MEGRVVACIRTLNEEGLLSDSQARELLAALSVAASPSMPVSRVHGDCNPNNMLLDRKSGVSVIDWEYSTTGWALWDLFTLVRTAWFQPTGVAEPSAVQAQEVWDPRTPMGRAFSVALRRYEIRWGIRREQCRVLFGAYIAQQLSEQLGSAPRVTPTEPWRTLLRAAVSH